LPHVFGGVKMGEAGRGQEVEFHKQLLLPHFPYLKMGEVGRGQDWSWYRQLSRMAHGSHARPAYFISAPIPMIMVSDLHAIMI
jgi:hypothetical protein